MRQLHPVELEVKILEIDSNDLISKLETMGAKKFLDAITHIEAFDYDGSISPMKLCNVPEKFKDLFNEVNSLTNGQNDLISKGAYLRLREEGDKCELILKNKVAGGNQNIKVEREISVPIKKEEWDNVRDIVLGTGLKRIILQEKHRISYVGNGVRFDIDTWPKMPTYVEIEGPEDAIKQAVKLLGFLMDQTTSVTGRELFQRYNIDPRNLFFEKK